MPIIPEQDLQKIAELLKEGLSRRKINEQYFFSEYAIRKVYQELKSKGVKVLLKHNPKVDSGFRNLLYHYNWGALKRNLIFTLTDQEFRKLTEGDCFYCGETPRQIHRGYVHNGIDRLFNDIGYEINNCVSCCGICNRMKSIFSKDNFLKQVKKIAAQLVKNL